MPAAALRRLPFREAFAAVSSGEGSSKLSPAVSGLAMRFVAKNSERGPRDFARTIAPRIAYANPALPFSIDRMPDPRTKSLDPEAAKTDRSAVWAEGHPEPVMDVFFHTAIGTSVGDANLGAIV